MPQLPSIALGNSLSPVQHASKTAHFGPRCFTSVGLHFQRFTRGQQKGIPGVCLYFTATHSNFSVLQNPAQVSLKGGFYIVNDGVNSLTFKHADHSDQHRSFTASSQKMERVYARDEHLRDAGSLTVARTTKNTKEPFNLEQYNSIQARTNRAKIAQRPTELSRQRANKEAQCERQTYDVAETRVVPFSSSGSDRQRNNQRVELDVHVLVSRYTEQSTLGLYRRLVKASSPLFEFISFIVSQHFDQYRQSIFDQHPLKSTSSLLFLPRTLMGLLSRNEIAGKGRSSLYTAPLECSSSGLEDDSASPKPVTQIPTPTAPTTTPRSPTMTGFSNETVRNEPSSDARSWETTTSQATPTPGPSKAGYTQMQYTIVGYQGDGLGAPTASTRPANRPSSNTFYQIYVGIAAETEKANRHFTVIVRFPPHLADPKGDCAWYHCRGWGIEETDYYRRVVNKPRPFESSYFARRIGVGVMTEAQRQDFRRAFRQTPPQPNEFFCIHFLRKLVKKGILQPYEIRYIEMMIGEPPAELEWDPDYCDTPEFGPETLDYEGNIPIFEMEDIDRV
ncbi:hypothetical protein BDV11DRAFT_208940 [Aspergillus similis]